MANTQNLDYYINKSLNNSPLLKDYQNQIEASGMDSLMIIASQKPQINANATALYAPSFTDVIHGYDAAITNGGTYSTTISAQQYIFNKKSLSSKYENIHIQQRSLINTRKVSTNDLKRVVTNQYLAVYADYSDITFNKSFLKLLNDERDILKSLVQQGIYKQTDFLSLLIETQTQEILVNQLSAQLTKDIHGLNQICGINDTANSQFSFPSIANNEQTDHSSNPLFQQFKIDSLKIVNQRSTIDVGYKPKISLIADVGFLSSTISNVYQHYGFSAGVNFTIPLYDGHQRKINYQRLAISENTRSNYESYFKNQYSQQVSQLQNDISFSKMMIEQQRNLLKSSEELITMAKVQLNHGNLLITDFLSAAKNYITINRNLNQSQIKVLQLINELNYLYQ